MPDEETKFTKENKISPKGMFERAGEFVVLADGILGVAIKGGILVAIGTTLYFGKLGFDKLIELKDMLTNSVKFESVDKYELQIEQVVISELQLKTRIDLADSYVTVTGNDSDESRPSVKVLGKEIRSPLVDSRKTNATIKKPFALALLPRDVGQIKFQDDGTNFTVILPITKIYALPNFGSQSTVNQKITSPTKKLADAIDPTIASKNDQATFSNLEDRAFSESSENGARFYADLLQQTDSGKNVGNLGFLSKVIADSLNANGKKRRVTLQLDFSQTKVGDYTAKTIFSPVENKSK
ncbi:MAG: hypothetical protein WCK98_07305 [bacterium]